MNLLFYSIHQSDQIRIYNSSVLSELTTMERINALTLKEHQQEKLFDSDFTRLFDLQVRKGRAVRADYDFFVEQHLIEANLPCLFSTPKEPSRVRKDVEGIATKFASLKTEEDILDFAKDYGLLGILAVGSTPIEYGPTVFEPIYFWRHYISEIKNLLKLYQMLKRKYKDNTIDIIGELIEMEENDRFVTFKWIEKGGGVIPFHIGRKELNNIPYKDYDEVISTNIFTNLVQYGLKGAINIDFSDFVKSKDSEIGFRIKKVYSTDYLLGAIYYDLWQLVSNDVEVLFCEHCGNSFTKSGRKKYCSDSCKTLAYLARTKRNQ